MKWKTKFRTERYNQNKKVNGWAFRGRMEGTKKRVSDLKEQQKLPNLNNNKIHWGGGSKVSRTCRTIKNDVMALEFCKERRAGLKKYSKK